MDYEVIKISELEETQNAENAWFLASEGIPSLASKRIKGSNIVPPVNVPSTFFVDRTYKGGDSNGSVGKPFANLQDAINASPTSGAYQRIICAPRQNYGDITIDRLVIIQTLGSSKGFGLSKIGNVAVTYSSFIMDMEIAGKVTVTGATILMIDRCRCLDDIQLMGGNEVKIHNSLFTRNKGILVEPTTPSTTSYIEASDVDGLSIKADNTRISAERCAFRSNTTFDSDYSGLVLTNAPMSFFRSCSFGIYNIENESQQAEVRVKIQTNASSVVHFVDCQVTDDIVKNENCRINDSYIRYTPQNYTASGNKITDHIEGIDKTLRTSGASDLYITRELTDVDYSINTRPAPTSGTVSIMKTGKKITLKYSIYYSGLEVNRIVLSVSPPSEIGELNESCSWGVYVATDNIGIQRSGYVGYIKRYDKYNFEVYDNKASGSESGYIYMEINTYLK